MEVNKFVIIDKLIDPEEIESALRDAGMDGEFTPKYGLFSGQKITFSEFRGVEIIFHPLKLKFSAECLASLTNEVIEPEEIEKLVEYSDQVVSCDLGGANQCWSILKSTFGFKRARQLHTTLIEQCAIEYKIRINSFDPTHFVQTFIPTGRAVLDNETIVDKVVETIINKFGGKEEKQSTCFIATAVLENPTDPKLSLLKWYRDQVLCTHLFGRIFCRFYYHIGPALATIVVKFPILKRVILHVLILPICMYVGRVRFKYPCRQESSLRK